MSERSNHRALKVFAGLALIAGVAACGGDVWTAPGWYLERPRILVVGGTELLSGPHSYEQCEAERLKARLPDELLCLNERVKPGSFGPNGRT